MKVVRKLIYCLFVLMMIPVFGVEHSVVKTIAIVKDRESPYFGKMVEGFLVELEGLSEDQYHLKVKEFNAGGLSVTNTRQTLLRALNDPEVDVVFTAGVASSHIAHKLDPTLRRKPIIAGAMELADLRNHLLSAEGTSKSKQYSFVLLPKRIENDLKALSKLAQTEVIDVLIESYIYDVLRDAIQSSINNYRDTYGLTIRVRPIGGSGKLPDLSQSRAVYIPLMPGFTLKQRASLFAKLTREKIPHLSIYGPKDVEHGALATLSPDIQKQLYRRLAVNFHQLFLGIDAEQLPSVLHLADQLTINLETAKKIGWSPDYDTALTANFIKENEVLNSVGTLDLEKVMKLAAQRNPDIAAGYASWLKAAAERKITQASFSPTVALSGQANAMGVGSRISPVSASNSQQASIGFEVNKLLYSNRIYQKIASASQLEVASTLDAESIALDTVEAAAHAYLDALSAEAIYQIQRDNVRLVQGNLGLAKIRKEIGSSDQADYLRWLASLASARSDLIRADSDRLNARNQLNTLIASDPDAHYTLTDIELNDKDTYFIDDALNDLVANQLEFQLFTKFIKDLSSVRAPELKSYDHNLRAQGILLEERKRRNVQPEIQLNATAQRLFNDSSISSRGTQNEWTLGVGFTLPFLEKDLQKSEVQHIQAGIAQLLAQRKKAAYLIEQKALSSCYNIGASHPSMLYARRAKEAAKKNYKLREKQYRLGQTDILSLLDAQSNWLTQRQAHATATYSYLKDITSMQRAIAWFEFSKSDDQIHDFINHFQDYKKTGSVHVRIKK